MGKSREDKMEGQCSITGVVCELHCHWGVLDLGWMLFLNVSSPEEVSAPVRRAMSALPWGLSRP